MTTLGILTFSRCLLDGEMGGWRGQWTKRVSRWLDDGWRDGVKSLAEALSVII